MKKLRILVTKTGMQFIYDDELAALSLENKGKVTRVSSVEPCEGGGWEARLTDGTVLGPYVFRKDCLNAEVKYLEERMFKKAYQMKVGRSPFKDTTTKEEKERRCTFFAERKNSLPQITCYICKATPCLYVAGTKHFCKKHKLEAINMISKVPAHAPSIVAYEQNREKKVRKFIQNDTLRKAKKSR